TTTTTTTTTTIIRMIVMTTKAPAYQKRTVHGTWQGGMRCDVRAGDHRLVVDEPPTAGGNDSGPQPTDLLLASVASWFTLALAQVARRQSIPLSSIAVSVTGTYEGLRFRSIAVNGLLGCTAAETEVLLRAAERLCYVTNTLRGDVDITVAAYPAPLASV